MTYWKTQHFKALQRQWYGRLEAEGFQDAEEIVGHELYLKQTATHAYRDADELEITTKETYYQLISEKVNESNFRNDVDRLILTRYAEGKKAKVIREELEGLGFRRCRMTIRMRIRVYEMEWGLRSYTPKQLNQKTS